MRIRGPIKCHGGKFFLSQWIVDHFPNDYEEYDFIEPYVGGGSVFLNKNRSKTIEVINDITDEDAKILLKQDLTCKELE
jgi:site-specific DNA-adenine methylase